MNESSDGPPPEIAGYIDRGKKNFKRMYDQMFKQLSAMDMAKILSYTKSRLIDDDKIGLQFFENEVIVDPAGNKVFRLINKEAGGKQVLDTYTSSIILHYLINADGTPIGGKWISYRELPGGFFYWQTVPKVLEPLIKKFGGSSSGFFKKASGIGGKKYPGFKFGSIIYPFKMFPVLMVLDEKSEEFEANIRILFDISAPHYLKTDVIKSVIIHIVKRLCS